MAIIRNTRKAVDTKINNLIKNFEEHRWCSRREEYGKQKTAGRTKQGDCDGPEGYDPVYVAARDGLGGGRCGGEQGY